MPNFNLADYETVQARIGRFWQDWPEGRILTELAYREGDTVAFCAAIYRNGERSQPDATGYAEETKGQGNVNRTSHIENCETSAIGRALANLGYATNGNRPSREEMQKADGATAATSRAATNPAPMIPADYAQFIEAGRNAGMKSKEAKALWNAICERFPADGSASDEALTYGLAQIEAMA
jgi:hypothetical protein